MKSIASIFFGLMLVVTLFYSMNLIGTESFVSNPGLSEQSQDLAANFNTNLNNNFNLDEDFDQSRSNLTDPANSTFDSQDVFAREFFERESQTEQNVGIIKTLVNIPDTVLMVLGVPEEDVSIYRTILLLVLGALITFAGFRAIFGGGRIQDN